MKDAASPTAALDFLLLLFIANLVLQPLVEPDFGWHLRAGLDLISQGWFLPVTDPYSHTMSEWHWVEHAWLTDGILGLLHRALGAYGPMAMILLFGSAGAGALWIGAKTGSAHRTARMVAMVCGLWVALPYLGARTQLVSLVGVALVLWVWTRMLRGSPRLRWWLPPIFLVWSNLHGGFTAGIFLLGLALAVSVGCRLLVEWRILQEGAVGEAILTRQEISRVIVVLAASCAVTLVNPYGWHLHGEIYDSLMDRYMLENLREWQPVSFQGWAGRAYLLYLVGLLLLAGGFYRRIEPVRWVLLAVFFLLSLLHWRNVTLFLVVSVPLLAELLEAAGGRFVRAWSNRRMALQGGLAALTVVAGVALYQLGADHLLHVWRCGTETDRYFEQTEYPIEAVRWIRDHRDQVGSHLYNEYGHGGFLLWWLPDQRIFIDGRMPAWRLGDRRIFPDYIRLNQADRAGLEILAKYHVDWALVGKGTPLAEALSGRAGWTVLYADPKVLVIKKEMS
ncbi:MAG: hypothetical protein KF814_04450 [Nitrospiraceae bacterium]|nr:hypothetical protein [Nitrospiraceae bacterium]